MDFEVLYTLKKQLYKPLWDWDVLCLYSAS